MIAVIICGGSGSRLWPLSTKDRPKQLLKLISDESLLQNAYNRARRLTDEVYILPEQRLMDLVHEQLPDLDDDHIIIEPGLRGTAACFIAALHHIQSRHDKDEPVAFLHSDHAIRDVDGFVYAFKLAERASNEHKRITLVGVEPTYPSTGFGYIHKAAAMGNGSLIFNVEGFAEKPEYDVAQRYVRSGQYYWNAGYFVGSVNTFVGAFETYSPQWKGYYDQLLATTDEQSYKDTYLSFQEDTIDYALMEHAKDLLVVPATFDWADLGSFKDIHEVVDGDALGNYINGHAVEMLDVENSLIYNQEQDKPVAVIGLDNVVVVNTPNGLLVARKDQSQKVKDIVKRFADK